MGTTSRNDDLITSYSSKGPTLIDHIVKPDLVAPGNRIISVEAPASTLVSLYPNNEVSSTVFWNYYSSSREHKYLALSGTSMATPAVSAAVALLLDKNSSLTPDQVKARLMKTASKTFPVSSIAWDPITNVGYISYYDMFTVGAGYLDVSAALANNDMGNGSAMSPKVSFNALTNTASLIRGNSVMWGSSVMWGDSVVWGMNAFVNGNIWGANGSWTSTSPSGVSVMWGDATTAATSVMWGDSTFAARTQGIGED
jgi:serine protease AprX